MSPKAASITDRPGAQRSRLDANTCERTEKRSEERVCEGQEEGDGARVYGIVSFSSCGGVGDRQDSCLCVTLDKQPHLSEPQFPTLQVEATQDLEGLEGLVERKAS